MQTTTHDEFAPPVITATRRDFLAASSAFAMTALFPAVAIAEEKLFTAAQVASDLDAIWSTLLDVGAEPFFTSDRAAVTRLYHATRLSLTGSMSVREAWVAISPVLGALNDGHVALLFPEPLNSAALGFPLYFVLADDNTLLVVHDRTRTVPIPSRVVSINGVSAERFTSVALSAFGGQTERLHRDRISWAGAWTAVALFGDRPPYAIDFVGPDGKARNATISTSETPAPGTASPPPYTYSTISEGTVGYINYRSCSDLQRFKMFLDETFANIRQSPVRALIIDIRKNGGGDSRLNDALWTYVSTKPFTQFGGFIEKACSRLKREYGREKYVQIYGTDAWNAPNGTILRGGLNSNSDLIVPGPLPIRYNGPVYLLISPETFSSAMSCALAAKDYGLATIVGEETAEPVNSTGEVYEETVPNTGMVANLTTKVFFAPKPHPNRQGVVPDVVVPTTPADTAAGRDPVLARTLAMIAHG